MKQLYNKFFDWLDKDNSGLKFFVCLLVFIMLVMTVLDKFDLDIGGRGGNPQESYQELGR